MDSQVALAIVAGTVAALLLVLGGIFLHFGTRQERELEERVRGLTKAAAPAATPAARKAGRGGGSGLDVFRRLGEVLRDRAFFSDRDLLDMERTVVAAGFDPRRAVPTFIGIKVIMFFLMPAAAFLFARLQGSGSEIAWTGGGAVVGLMGPNWVLGYLRKKHIGELRRGMSSAWRRSWGGRTGRSRRNSPSWPTSCGSCRTAARR